MSSNIALYEFSVCKLSHAFLRLVIFLYEVVDYSQFLLLLRNSIVHCFDAFCSPIKILSCMMFFKSNCICRH